MFVHLLSGTASSWSDSKRSIFRNEPGIKSASRKFISAWMEIFMEEEQQNRSTAMSLKRFYARR